MHNAWARLDAAARLIEIASTCQKQISWWCHRPRPRFCVEKINKVTDHIHAECYLHWKFTMKSHFLKLCNRFTWNRGQTGQSVPYFRKPYRLHHWKVLMTIKNCYILHMICGRFYAFYVGGVMNLLVLRSFTLSVRSVQLRTLLTTMSAFGWQTYDYTCVYMCIDEHRNVYT